MKKTVTIFRSYIATITDSLGLKKFKTLYIKTAKGKIDVLRKGELSCAYFVTSVIHQFSLIDRPHATVDNTIVALEKNGWKRIKKERSGCVLLWEEKNYGEEQHKHIGFYIGGQKAISNSSLKSVPVVHQWKFKTDNAESRKITAMYWHKDLNH